MQFIEVIKNYFIPLKKYNETKVSPIVNYKQDGIKKGKLQKGV